MADGRAPAPDGVVPMIDVTRGAIVESRHCGAAAVVAADGTVVAAWGDVERLVYPRSALKTLQALPLIETGAADAFGLTDPEIAIACASHSGSADHVATAAAMLRRIELDEAALACGPQPPSDAAEQARLAAAGDLPGRAHNNCSGKHAAMLLVARHLAAPVEGYHRVTHPVQQRVLGAAEQMTGLDLGGAPRGVDGCSLPIWALPLGNLALAMARLADPDDQPEPRRHAIARLWQAQVAAPEMVDGTGRFVTETVRHADGAVLVKNGAEGVYVASIRDRGLGIAVKIADGGDRAAKAAIAALLLRFAAPAPALKSHLADAERSPVLNWAGETVGAMRPAEGWPGPAE